MVFASDVLTGAHHLDELLLGEAQRAAARIRRDVARHEAAETPPARQIVLEIEVCPKLPGHTLVLWLAQIWIVERRVAAGAIAQWEKPGKGMTTTAICRRIDQIGTKPHQVGILAGEVQLVLRNRRSLKALLYDGSFNPILCIVRIRYAARGYRD